MSFFQSNKKAKTKPSLDTSMEAIKTILNHGINNVLSSYGGSVFIRYLDTHGNSSVYTTNREWATFTELGIKPGTRECRCDEHGKVMEVHVTAENTDFLTKDHVVKSEDDSFIGNEIMEQSGIVTMDVSIHQEDTKALMDLPIQEDDTQTSTNQSTTRTTLPTGKRMC